jgi:hypothetical protein
MKIHVVRAKYLVVPLLVLLGPGASAVTYHSPGIMCFQEGSDGTPIHGSGGEFYNNHASLNLATNCVVTQIESTTVDVQSFRLDYKDDNSGTEVLADYFYCRLKMVTDNRTYYYSSYLHTCSTAGGCASADTTWKGSGYLSWGNDFTSLNDVFSVGFWCLLPENSNEGSISSIEDYRVELAGN